MHESVDFSFTPQIIEDERSKYGRLETTSEGLTTPFPHTLEVPPTPLLTQPPPPTLSPPLPPTILIL